MLVLRQRTILPPKPVLWFPMALCAMGVALYSVPRYLALDGSLNPIPLDPDFAAHLLWLSMHAVPSAMALFLGPFQFLSSFRSRHPRWHRTLGRLYLLAVLLGSLAAAVSTYASQMGVPVQIGFAILSAAWLYTGFEAYRTARARDFSAHRIWMIRNYGLTFGAVLLRIFIGIGELAAGFHPSLTFQDIYTSSVWCAVLFSVLVPEWLIVSRQSAVRR